MRLYMSKDMWLPIAATYYISRALEDGHALFFVLVGAIVIGIIIYKRPRYWQLWAVLTAVAALVLAAVSGSRDRHRY